MVQHRLTIQPLDAAEVGLLFPKSVEVQLPVVARQKSLKRRMLQPKEVPGRTFRCPVLGVRRSRQPGGADDLDGRLGDRLLGLDVRHDEVDPGLVGSLRECTIGFRTAFQLLKLLLELRDLDFARVRVQDGWSLGGRGLRAVKVGPRQSDLGVGRLMLVQNSRSWSIFVTHSRRCLSPVESKTRTHYGPVGSGRRTAGRRGWAGLGRTRRRRVDPVRKQPSVGIRQILDPFGLIGLLTGSGGFRPPRICCPRLRYSGRPHTPFEL